MIAATWQEIPRVFSGTELDAFVVMPNHFHAILTLDVSDIEANPDLAEVIGWFKGTTTHRYARGVRHGQWPPFEEKLWQPKFYEHIIRDDLDMDRFRAYIDANPAEWANDRYRNPER
jgi:putative transposase